MNEGRQNFIVDIFTRAETSQIVEATGCIFENKKSEDKLIAQIASFKLL